MRILKALSALLFIVLLIAVGFCACFYWHGWDSNQRYKQGYFDGYAFIKPIEDLQRQVGCTKIDGKLGPCWLNSETQTKYELALGNQYSTWMFNSNVREFDRKMLVRIKK